MPRRHTRKPKGISEAAIKGARQGEKQPDAAPAPDARTVNPNEARPPRTSENDEAPLGGGSVAFPAPSAQPTRTPPTQRPAKVDVAWTSDEDDEKEWRRAGGGEDAKEK